MGHKLTFCSVFQQVTNAFWWNFGGREGGPRTNRLDFGGSVGLFGSSVSESRAGFGSPGSGILMDFLYNFMNDGRGPKNKKAVLSHGNRAMPQLFFSVYPRTLILAPVESAFATFYWSSVVILVLSCPVSEILQVFYWEQLRHPIFHPNFRGVLFGLDCRCCDSEERIIRVVNFELVQPMLTVYQRYRQTDRVRDIRTDDSNTALALRASRGKNGLNFSDGPYHNPDSGFLLPRSESRSGSMNF